MRIWNQKLLPILCKPHLFSMWKMGVNAYIAIVDEKNTRNPIAITYQDSPFILWNRLIQVREELVKRGYEGKNLPMKADLHIKGQYVDALTQLHSLHELNLRQQVELLREENCACGTKEIWNQITKDDEQRLSKASKSLEKKILKHIDVFKRLANK